MRWYCIKRRVININRSALGRFNEEIGGGMNRSLEKETSEDSTECGE